MRARAREYKEKTAVYINGLRVPGGVRMPGAEIAKDLISAINALEASRRECEELRAELADGGDFEPIISEVEVPLSNGMTLVVDPVVRGYDPFLVADLETE